MRDLSPAELAALRAIDNDRPVRWRYTPRGPSGTTLPSTVAILRARDLVTYNPELDRYATTEAGREILARLDRGAQR